MFDDTPVPTIQCHKRDLENKHKRSRGKTKPSISPATLSKPTLEGSPRLAIPLRRFSPLYSQVWNVYNEMLQSTSTTKAVEGFQPWFEK